VRHARPALIFLAVLATVLPFVPQHAASVLVSDASASDAAWTTPTMPPRCTTAQVDSGDVAGCHVWGARGKPEDWGWPTPPFPETVDGQAWPPPGWVFDGWSFTGSPALAEWEALMASNPSPYGRIGTGRIRLLPEALVLFDGFLREVAARGYNLRDGMGYNYRCTITSATNSCQGLTRTSLSMHAYGLAVDINGSLNPPRTYSGIDGATACATPMMTDMPQWLVQVAEKWGLYWGGYGWSSGCASPTTSRTSVYRDPTHFEFRGSPSQARAIAAFNGAGVDCYDTVDAAGTVRARCPLPGQVPPAGTRTVIDTGAPAGAVAALVNLTATETQASGYVTAESCGPVATPVRPTSNLNIRRGVNVANLAVVNLDTQGRFCLYQLSASHLVVDVQGFFLPAAAAPTGSSYRPIVATRILDTRGSPGLLAAGSTTALSAATPGATAVLVNLTATESVAPGFVTADSCAAMAAAPVGTSNVNYGTGSTVANLAVVPTADVPGGVGFCAFTLQGTHLVADVSGWFAPGPGGVAYTAAVPSRVLDSRECRPSPSGTTCNAPLQANTITRLAGVVGATAVLANLVMVEPPSGGYVTVGPCATMAAGVQPTSNVNATPGAIVANLAVVTVEADGSFCAYASTTTHLVVDIQGSFGAGGSLLLNVIAPDRAIDTRG
jgi:hypothetical protein